MPFARDLHPEFGYIGSGPRLWRKVGIVLAFTVFGLIAATSGLSIFMAPPEPDPMQAMALAPAQPLIRLPSAADESTPSADASAQTPMKASRIKSPSCGENAAESLSGNCAPARTPRPAPAVNERPAIATVAIGRQDGPALLSSEPAIAVSAMPQMPEGSAMPAESADAPPAVAPTGHPPAVIKKSRPRTQARHRERNQYVHSPSSNGYQGGYARLW